MGGETITLESIIRIIISIAIAVSIIFIVLPIAGNWYKSDTRFIESFSNFVANLDEMSLGKDTILLKMKEDAAIIGFGKESDSYGYVKTAITMANGKDTIKFKRPTNAECIENACVCLCQEELEEDNNEISCEDIRCKTLEKTDIIDSTLVFIPQKLDSDDLQYWKGGFLFGRDINDDYNGIPKKNYEILELRTEKTVIGNKQFVGVCSSDMLKISANSRNYHFEDKCIITELDEAKKYEELADKSVAIQKYGEFTTKYKSGKETEESLFRLGSLYAKLGDNQKAEETFNMLIEIKNPKSQFVKDAKEELKKLRQTESEETEIA